MSDDQYLLLGYGLCLGLLWGYAIRLWIASHALRKREASEGMK